MAENTDGRRVVIVRLSHETVQQRLGLPGPVLDARVDHFAGAMLELVVADPDADPVPEGVEPPIARYGVDIGGDE